MPLIHVKPAIDNTYGILVTDGLFSGRENLHSFLQAARRNFPNTLLWIDANSIDQENDEEKGK
jgi:hypothetical protein